MQQNPILQMLKSNNLINNLGQIKQMLNMVRTAQDPSALLKTMAQSNPQLQLVMSLIDQSGGDPKTAFYQAAKEQGVDPNEILNLLR